MTVNNSAKLTNPKTEYLKPAEGIRGIRLLRRILRHEEGDDIAWGILWGLLDDMVKDYIKLYGGVNLVSQILPTLNSPSAPASCMCRRCS
jgi:hypothetical protein